MFTLESLYKSLIKQIVDVKDSIKNDNISLTLEYHAWDSRHTDNELPNNDLIGLVGWAYSENEGLPTVQLGILLSSVMDKNLFKEIRMLDKIRDAFVLPGGHYKTVTLFDPISGEEYAQMQVTNFEIMPAGRSEMRSTRNIGIELVRTTGD